MRQSPPPYWWAAAMGNGPHVLPGGLDSSCANVNSAPYIGGRPDPRSSVRCSYPPLVTALGLRVAGSVQTCNASFASFATLQVSQVSQVSFRAKRCLGTRVQRFECRFEGFRDAPEILFENLRAPSTKCVLPKKTKIADGLKIVGNHTTFCGGPRGGPWIAAEVFLHHRFLAKVLVELRIFTRKGTNLINSNHAFFALHYSIDSRFAIFPRD